MAKLSLDDMRPADHDVEIYGEWYKLPGDVPVDTIIDVMKMTGQLSDADQLSYTAKRDLAQIEARLEGVPLANVSQQDLDAMHEQRGLIAESEKIQGQAMATMRDIVLDLFRMRQDEERVEKIRLSPDEVSVILGLVTGGEDDAKPVPLQVVEDLTGGGVGELDADGRPTSAAKAATARRSRSAKRSPAQSSA